MICTITGGRVTPDGIVVPKKGRGKLLDCIFGAQAPNTSFEFRSIESNLVVLADVKKVVESKKGYDMNVWKCYQGKTK